MLYQTVTTDVFVLPDVFFFFFEQINVVFSLRHAVTEMENGFISVTFRQNQNQFKSMCSKH